VGRVSGSWSTLCRAALGEWVAVEGDRLLQGATEGRWETARRLALPAGAAAVGQFVDELAGDVATETAVEVEWPSSPLVFVGAGRAQPDDPGFAADVTSTVVAGSDDPGRVLPGLAGGEPTALASIDLGAANAWRSVGPLELWSRHRRWDPEALTRRLIDHPALADCVVPVAVQLVFEGPRTCWLGLEVSERHGARHLVRASRVAALVTGVLSAHDH
jgi:hypothetical protein